MRRFFRVLPLYYLLLGVSFGLKTSIFREMSEPYWQSPAPWWSYLTFTQNLFFDGHGVGGYLLGVTWSLAIEEQFYLFFPLIVRVMNFRFLVLFLLAAILAAPTMRELFGQGARLTFTLCRLDCLSLGALIAVLEVRGMFFEHRQKWFVLGCGLLGVGSIGLQVGGSTRSDWTFSFLALMYSGLLIMTLCSRNVIRGAMSFKPLVFLGEISYALYLTHLPLLQVSRAFFGPIDSWGELGTVFTILLLTACFLHWAVERPLRDLGRRLAPYAPSPPHVDIPRRTSGLPS